jgi:nucleoid DNA-binding protein
MPTAKKSKSAKTSKKGSKSSKPSSSQIMTDIAARCGLTKRQVADVTEALREVIGEQLKQSGEFAMFGLCKIVVKRRPAKSARQGMNPFTKQMTTFLAQAAKNVLKVRPLKKLKDMV